MELGMSVVALVRLGSLSPDSDSCTCRTCGSGWHRRSQARKRLGEEGKVSVFPLKERGEEMDKALKKVASFSIPKKAKEEISSIGEDLSRFSSTVEEKAKWIFEKLKGKPSKSLPDLLREYGLPQGLFPRNIICYEFDESKSKLIVHLPSTCEISFKDSSVLRYATRVKATLSRGKLSGIEGMKTKVLVWVKVTQVSLESYKSDKVCFMAGVKKLRPKDAYEIMPRDSITVEEF
ncbi:uncharacterized protein At5g01610 isoform X1 [Musa acuminata AAA Group]|uniref:uncharacterized protein At5g01610 isoform X1 n=1 Tax=Musa acuminata AAA Group TaxID=214697 RepID=UPI0031CF85DC